jgi:hypothetical protein
LPLGRFCSSPPMIFNIIAIRFVEKFREVYD